MNSVLPIILMLIFITSCTEKKPIADPRVLMDADIAFSNYSLQNGLQKAFIEFAHDSVVLLKPNRMPIEGKQSLVESYRALNDSNMKLTWKPEKAIIARSGELGYTYGLWTSVSSKDTVRGTYLTVWKKNEKGEWKYIADTGNEGIGK
ncbi:MAG: DUF4440 domain-containing protein [Verrucomicrobia bacterium]|nr:DUF4440 domain-containing protein [Prolixibacteraceae bacterium]